MKLTCTVMGERRKTAYANSETEPYAVADVLVDGDAALIAASLRALADSLEPPALRPLVDSG